MVTTLPAGPRSIDQCFEAEQTRTRELTQRTQELTETLEYQTTTSEVVSVISRSPSELQPVLDSIAETASRPCQADFAYTYRLQGKQYRLAAINSTEVEYVKWLKDQPISPSRV
jgi:two-component system, NtrC family, sensor kinase